MDYLFCLFKQYCTFSEEDNNKFLIFLRENDINEIGDVFIHNPSYSQTIEFGKEFVRRKNETNSFVAAIAHKEAMKEPICPESIQEFLAFLNTIDDQFVPRCRDHIFQVFKKKIVDNFNVRMLLDGLSKTAVYYVLMHEIIPGLRYQFQDSRGMPYTQNGIHHSYKLAKLLASLWIAIVIPDDEISEAIFCHFDDIYTNKWILDGMDSMIMAYIAFGGSEQRIIEFEASQRAKREDCSREERKEDCRSREDCRSGEDSKKTSKQKRQEANRKAKKYMSK